MKQTIMANAATVVRKWYVIDAKGVILGRLATKVATILRGKHKPTYTPHVDCGDAVIVINAKEIRVTGRKMKLKTYKRYSGYPGGLKETTLEKLLQTKPIEPVKHAIKGMLPKGPLGRDMFKKLKVYAGDKHPHIAQAPKVLEV